MSLLHKSSFQHMLLRTAASPFLVCTSTSGDSEVVTYRFYLHYTKIPINNRSTIAYRNPPFFALELFDLQAQVTDYDVAFLSKEFIQFVVTACNLLTGQSNTSIETSETLLTHAWMLSDTWKYGHLVQWYPGVVFHVGTSLAFSNAHIHMQRRKLLTSLLSPPYDSLSSLSTN